MNENTAADGAATTKRRSDCLSCLGRCLEIVALLVAATAAVFAYHQYRASNHLQTYKALNDYDRAIMNYVRVKPHLEAFFASFPEDLSPEERAERRIKLLAGNEYKTRKWKNVQDLSCMLFEENDFANPTKEKLREAYSVAEEVLYLIDNAYDARRKGFITEKEYRTWWGYLDEVGDHPLFLAAVDYWHQMHYITPELASELRKKLLRPKARGRATLEKFYPQMLRPDWAKLTGEESFLGCPCVVRPKGAEYLTLNLPRKSR